MQINFTINIDDKLVSRIKSFCKNKPVTIIFTLMLVSSAVFLFAENTWTGKAKYTFSNGDTIFADQINANFNELYEKVNSLSINLTGLPVGTIVAWAGQQGISIPEGWLLCDGRDIPEDDDTHSYKKLREVLQFTYGSSTYKLPDLRGRVIVGVNQSANSGVGRSERIPDIEPYNVLDNLGGCFGDDQAQVTLSLNEIPSHIHNILSILANPESGFQLAFNITSGYFLGLVDTTKTESAGGGKPHNNIQPSIALHYIIKAIE